MSTASSAPTPRLSSAGSSPCPASISMAWSSATSPTFRWHAVHDFERWVTSDEFVRAGLRPGVGARADRALPPGRGVLCREHGSDTAASSARAVTAASLIGADSMTEFIENRRDDVRWLIERVDILFLTASELAALTGDDDWRVSAARPVRHGPSASGRREARTARSGLRHRRPRRRTAGCACRQGRRPDRRRRCACRGLPRVRREGSSAATTPRSLRRSDEGIRCAAEAIVDFGTGGLRGTRTV